MRKYIQVTYAITSDTEITEEDLASVMEFIAEQDYEGHPAGEISFERIEEVKG